MGSGHSELPRCESPRQYSDHDRACDLLGALEAKPADIAATLADLERKGADVRQAREPGIRAMALNDALEEVHTVHFDAARQYWLTARTDLRNIEQLMSLTATPANQRMNVSRDGTTLYGPSLVGVYSPAAPCFTIMDRFSPPVPAEPLLRSPLRLGTVPDNWFNAPRVLMERLPSEAQADLRVTFHMSHTRTEVEIDASLAFRYRRLRVFSTAGRLREEDIADDYRNMDGAWIPFRHERVLWEPDGTERHRELLLVQEACLSAAGVDAAGFQLELHAGTRVNDLRPAGKKDGNGTVATAGRAVSIEDLPGLVSALRSEGAARPSGQAPER